MQIIFFFFSQLNIENLMFMLENLLCFVFSIFKILNDLFYFL